MGRVEFPELNQERAVVWFVAHKTENKSLHIENAGPGELSDNIFPSPASDYLYVPLFLGDIAIYNELGQVQTLAVSKKDEQYQLLDVSRYAKGVYIVVSKSLNTSFKFVKL